MNVAVIDLGTNTFNLLVADVSQPSGISALMKKELAVKLGEGGIHEKIITPEAFARGLDAFDQLYTKARQNNAREIIAVATSGVRSAVNGDDFLHHITNHYGIQVRAITGEEEAELIYRGVRQAVPMQGHVALIIDIGGGSNEFIIGGHAQYFWKRSLDIGIARLLQRFQPSDPITTGEVNQIQDYLTEQLAEVNDAVEKYQPDLFVGCAGTFQTVRNMLYEDRLVNMKQTTGPSFAISYDQFQYLHSRLLRSTAHERKTMKGLELYRVDMIVLASIFVNFIMEKFGFGSLVQSDFSIKEGALDQHYYNP